MNSMSLGSTDSSPGSRFKRSVASKLGAYLPSRTAHINGFSIKLDEPHRQYGPGDTVRGSVVLDVGRPLGVTHVVVCLYGYVEVFRSHQKSSRIHRRNNFGRTPTGNSKRWVAEYYGDGFASLFEEEIVLCGEGRLDPKLYHFRFEVDFPSDLDLPTSIDFERGQISYMLTATITRPSAMTAPTTCDAMLYYRDMINVATLPPPKPQDVTLRAVEKPIRPKANLKRLSSYDQKPKEPRLSNLSRTTQSIRSFQSREQRAEVSRHPSFSAQSSRSSSSSRRPSPSVASDILSTAYSKTSRTDGDSSGKSITASVQLGTSGCLPGEVITVIVNIDHTKVVKSPHGVIATLFRQARVDMHPNLPVILADKKERNEDYYPRSKTGLGGLSLSAAGSSQVWRKDLSQAFAPLYIDPMSMTTEVKLAVRVPDEAFPTIRNVPGDMISFNYHIEVIIDIHGKLNSSERSRGLNITAPQSTYPSTPSAPATEPSDPMLASWGSNCVDTTPMRRHKDAVRVMCDVVVGTRGSQKALGKRRLSFPEGGSNGASSTLALDETLTETKGTAVPSSNHTLTNGSPAIAEDIAPEEEGYWGYDGYWYPHNYDYEGQEQEQEHYDYGYAQGWEQGYALAYGHMNGHYQPPHPYNMAGPPPPHNGALLPHFYPAVPPPNLEAESGLTEKERLRRAEAALLPSAPPGMEEASMSNGHDAPSAPLIPEEAHLAQPRPVRHSPLEHVHEDPAASSTPRPSDVPHSQSFQRTSPPPGPRPDQDDRPNGPTSPGHVARHDEAPSAPYLSREDEALIQGTRHLDLHENEAHVEQNSSGTRDFLPRYER